MNLAPKQLFHALQPPVQEPYETVAFLISAGLWSPKMLSFHVVVIFQITIPWKYSHDCLTQGSDATVENQLFVDYLWI